LIIAHRQELVEQAARHCQNAYPDKSIDIEMGKLHATGAADITVASIASIISGDRMAKFDPERFKLVLVDEAHHIVAPGYLKTLNYFGLSKAQPNSPALVGVSATLSRFDGLRLGAALDQIVYHKDYIDMIGEKWLSDVIFTTVESTADISKVKRGATGDFQAGELSRAVNTAQINDITVRTWLAKAEGRKSTLVFCIDLAHVSELTKAFQARGINARFVTGDTPRAERSATLDGFRAGDFPVLVNCGVFTEGTDVPNIDCVLLARPTKSRNLLVQMIGRGMRLHPGKANCHIIDMVASLETGVISTPTLFGLDPHEIVNEANIDDMKILKEGKALEGQSPGFGVQPARNSTRSGPISVTFTDYDSVFDLIEDTTGERHIRSISQYAWVQVAEQRYILTTATGRYLKLDLKIADQEDDALYIVSEVVPLKIPGAKSPFKSARLVAKAETFQNAVYGADTYAKANYPHAFISKHQSWRKGPATQGQLDFLNKLRPRDDALTPEDITKGKAGEMITKIKHGARGRFADLAAIKKRAERVISRLEQEEAQRRREHVSVGPLLD
jgi:ATP-dependent helicase IRC3